MTIDHHEYSNESISDLGRVLQKLSETQRQLHQAQAQISALKTAENEYISTIDAQHQKLFSFAEIAEARYEQGKKEVSVELQIMESDLRKQRDQHAQVVSDLKNEISAVRKNCENRLIQWNSEKAVLEVDLLQLRVEFVHCNRQNHLYLHRQNELTEQYVQRSEQVIQALQQKITDANNINEKLQNDILKLSLEKKSLRNRALQMQNMYIKTHGTVTEISLSHAIAISKRDSVIASLKKELGRVLRNPTAQTNVVEGDDGRCGNVAHLEEAALIREFNSNLFEKLAASEDQVNHLTNQVHVLQDQLRKSRKEVHSYVRRVETGALIVESDSHKTDWKSSSKMWSTPEERFSLLHKMELLLQETILENSQLVKEKTELGERLMALHNSINGPS